MTMNKHKENPYKILGVTPEADEKDIKKAYRKMAMKYHPDKQTTQEEKTKANLMFSKISAAYQTVIDIDHLDGSKRSDWEGSSRTDHNNSSRSRSAPRSPVVSSHRRSVNRSHSPPPPTSPGLFSKARISFGTPKRGDSPSKRDTSPHHRHHASGSPNRRSSLGSKPRPRPRPSGAGTHQFPRKNVSTGTNPRPRPQSPGRLSGHPKKHMSTGASVTRNSGTVSLTGNAPMGRPRRQSSTGALPKSRKFRDPFLIFDQVMNEEYGKDYKKKAAHEWNLDEKGKHLLTKSPKNKKKPSAKHAFKDIDSNGDDALSKGELRKFVESNSELWAVLGTNLGLGEKTCINIATQVAFSLAKGETDEKTSKKPNAQLVTDYELSEKEFKTFYKEYVLSQKGSYDFFLRTIFAVFDANGDGVLQKDEFENFLDVFYKAKNAYRMKLTEMPSKPNFMRIAEARLDKNKDGVLSYMEVRDLLAVAALVTTDKTTTKK